jgi:hypothetical protein
MLTIFYPSKNAFLVNQVLLHRYLQVVVKNHYFYVGFDVLTAVVMKSTILWDITPYVVRWKSTNISKERIASVFREE